MVRADDHWREGEIASTSLSIAVGTVSIGTDVEVSDLVIVNDDSKTSADLFLAIVAAQARAAGLGGLCLMGFQVAKPLRQTFKESQGIGRWPASVAGRRTQRRVFVIPLLLTKGRQKMKLDGNTLVAIVAVLAIVFGWTVVDSMNAERDLVNERREQRVSYLVDAYRDIARATNRKATSEDKRRLEPARLDVQLFGTKEHVEALSKVPPKNGDWAPVLEALRIYIREEFDMPPTEQN